MRLIGKHRLASIQGISDEVDLWVAAWVTEVSHATWKDSSSILAAFPRASLVDSAIFVFPVCGKQFPQIIMKIKFGMDQAMISKVIKQ